MNSPLPALPIHFFTIVLNGEPFIRYHLDCFKKLKCPWHWHIIEGLAELKHDTAWSLPYGATLPTDAVRDGRSIDGTAAYLDQIVAEHPGQISLYRAPVDRNWEGKLEMIRAPMGTLEQECLLWQIDSDELWTPGQIELVRLNFLRDPTRTAASFHCWFFVGPGMVMMRGPAALELTWWRVWRFKPGMQWISHEPPKLAARMPRTNQWVDVAKVRPFTPADNDPLKLIFQHFAYATAEQLRFKETYYGYKGIAENWRRLQECQDLPVLLRSYFDWPWVPPGARVDRAERSGVMPLMRV